MDSTRQFEFQSAVNGESYRIKLFIPSAPPPPEGYPAIYVLDGDVFFGSFAEAVRNRSQAGEFEPAIVVAIGGADGPSGADRTLDFTPFDLTPYEKTIVKDLGKDPPFGGYEKFRRVMQDEIKSKIGGIVHADPMRTTLFGWSLGGLFVMNTMMKHPGDFRNYLALSPSLWRSDRAIFGEVPNFKRLTAERSRPLRLFIGVGSLEEQVPPNWPTDTYSHADFAKEAHYAKEVQNAEEMAKDLTGYFARRHWALGFKIFKGDTHTSVPWSALNPMLSFAFDQKGGSHG